MNSMHAGSESPHSAFAAWIDNATAHTCVEATTTNTASTTSHIDAVSSHNVPVASYVDAATARIANITTYTAPGTIKHLFEPTSTDH